MQKDYVYPRLGDRTSPKEWAEIGRPDLVEKAIATKRKFLAEGRNLIDPARDKAIRERFPIHL
jgi:trimethylamine--corrinoid protein Co-methyltransferase